MDGAGGGGMDMANPQYSGQYDEKVRCCGQGCYEPTWKNPTCCFCLPYEQGLRILMTFFLLETLGLIGGALGLLCLPDVEQLELGLAFGIAALAIFISF